MREQPAGQKAWTTRVFESLERRFDRVRRGLRRSFGVVRPIEVVPYLGFGSSTRFFLRGRVLEDKGITAADPGDSRWRNLVNTYKRFISDEVPSARLMVRCGEVSCEVTTDHKGYYMVWLELEAPVNGATPWQEVEVHLLEPRPKNQPDTCALGTVLVPPKGAEFGVISDIDDTVIETDATRWFRVLVTIMFGNAKTRPPFRGVAAFYRALQEGSEGKSFNPLFYVSSSPWNLYGLLLEFLKLEGIPLGPLSLRNWRDSAESSLIPKEHGSYKKSEICRILETYPALPFILIGDSGQEDPEIYRDIVSDYPGRILAVYIRNVSGAARSQEVAALAAKVKEAGSRLILADDTLAAAKHALEMGWISAPALQQVRAAKEEDEGPRHKETEPLVIDGDEPSAR